MDLGLFQPVITKSIELIDEEVRFLFGVKNSMKLLRRDLLMIKAFLREIEGKQKGRMEKELFKQIQDVAYESEDLIETYIFKVERQQRRTGFVGSWILCPIQQLKVHLVGTKIQGIRQNLSEILANGEKFKLGDINKSEASSSNQSLFHAERRESSIEDEIGLVGMKNEAQWLVDQLITGDANNSIVSLIGMGGIGKTTLARKIYNSDLVRNHFHHRSWVTVSKPFILSRELLVNIMAHVNCINKQDEEEMKKIGAMKEQELGEKLSGYLRCKRYLVVLDDVWTKRDWDLLKHIFPVVDNKGVVMLTSRNLEVGKYANPRSPPCEIRLLNEEEAWELFCKKVLDCPSDLEDLGKKIVGKCGGLPLAVAVLGGILRGREKNLSEWEALLKSMKWELLEGESKIREILALSYSDLPYYLKPCFLYLSVFPEDFVISATKLILLWVAEGFIEERKGLTKEETGQEYLKELVRRSLVQIKTLKCDGRIKSCHIHDLLHEFCISEGRQVNFVHVWQGQRQGHDEVTAASGMSARRQSIIQNASINSYVSQAGSLECLRTFLTFAGSYVLGKTECKHLFRGFRLLRVIDLVGVGITRLPKEFGGLIHLRYLGLKGTKLEVFPSSLRRLSNLETLDVNDCGVDTIPDFVLKLPRLRHLMLPSANDIFYFQPERISLRGVPESNSLQTLRACVTAVDESFGNLIHLKKLSLLDNFDARQANCIAKMKHLWSLRLSYWGRLEPSSMHLAGKESLTKLVLRGELDKVPSRHDFPPQLTKLILASSKLSSDPFEELQHLPNLRILELKICSYVGSRLVSSGGGFPRLESLALEVLYKLEEWEVEEGAFPRLSHIRIKYCPKLGMLPEGFRHITTLNELELVGMTELVKDARGEGYYKIQQVKSLFVEERRRRRGMTLEHCMYLDYTFSQSKKNCKEIIREAAKAFEQEDSD